MSTVPASVTHCHTHAREITRTGSRYRQRVLSHGEERSLNAQSDNPTRVPIADHTGFGLIGLESASGLRAQFLPTGALFALRHREILINQLLPGPAEDGLFRLLVR